MSNSKEKFKEIFEKNITRDGAKELLEFLEKTDFFSWKNAVYPCFFDRKIL